MTVITFPSTARVEITAGIVTSSTVTDANGTHPDPGGIGKFKFFVDVVEANGCRISMWDGERHDDAVRVAEGLASDFGARIIDTSGGAS